MDEEPTPLDQDSSSASYATTIDSGVTTAPSNTTPAFSNAATTFRATTTHNTTFALTITTNLAISAFSKAIINPNTTSVNEATTNPSTFKPSKAITQLSTSELAGYTNSPSSSVTSAAKTKSKVTKPIESTINSSRPTGNFATSKAITESSSLKPIESTTNFTISEPREHDPRTSATNSEAISYPSTFDSTEASLKNVSAAIATHAPNNASTETSTSNSIDPPTDSSSHCFLGEIRSSSSNNCVEVLSFAIQLTPRTSLNDDISVQKAEKKVMIQL